MTQRIVSLLPAATEIVSALGAAELLVGRSHECDWPENISSLPVLTAPKIDPTTSSREIDQAIKDSDSEPLFSLNESLLRELSPDLILTQSACSICAVDVGAVTSIAASLSLPRGGHPDVLALAPQSVHELMDDIVLVGSKIEKQAEAEELIALLNQRITKVVIETQKIEINREKKPRIALVEWLDPPMSAGNWVPEMIRMAGAIDTLGADAGKSHWIDWNDVAAADPDIVILIPCGFELERVLTEAKTPAVWPHLKDLRATREGKLFGVDGHHLFNRPGPRLVDSLEVLAELLHPESFQFEATARFAKRIDA
jgi:iron complex transport system substrate-binding protein